MKCIPDKELKGFPQMKLLMPEGNYPERVKELSQSIRSAKPVDPDKPVRMPFDRSFSDREKKRKEGHIEVPQKVYESLQKMLIKN